MREQSPRVNWSQSFFIFQRKDMLRALLLIGLFSHMAFAQQKDFSPAEATLLRAEGLRLWQKRDDLASLEEALSKLEKYHETFPADLETLTYLARGYFTLAELHYTSEDLKRRTFERAISFGEKGLGLNEVYKKLADDDIERAIDRLTVNEIPVLFWSAAARGQWARLNGVMSSIKYKGQIVASIKRVEKLKPDYFFAAVPRYWGGFYAVAPSIAGGDMNKSKKFFKRAMAEAPEYLGTKNLYAELYLVKKADKKEFKKILLEVLAAPNGPDDIVPDNMLEKKRAEHLLDKIDELF